jgi:flagellar motor protein MotB
MIEFSYQAVSRRTAIAVALLCCVWVSGCRQPAGPAGNRAALFDFTRGSNSRFANNSQTGQDRYASNAPGLQINDGRQNGSSFAGEVQNLNQRLGAFDADNQLLNTEVAALQQKLQLANQYNQTLKEQLAGTTSQVQQSFSQRQAAAQQVAAMQRQLEQANQNLRLAQQQAQQQAQKSSQLVGFNNRNAPTSLAGGATIRANNSLMNRLSSIQIPGGQARMDGDVIRIEFPSDRMFVPGTYQIQPAQMPLLQNVVGTIKQSFPRQIIGIEAHWDNTPLNPPTATHHQLTATQALAVFEQLVRLGLPNNQLFTMAMASNRPRHRQSLVNGISPNRRIELVIYPETFDGS